MRRTTLLAAPLFFVFLFTGCDGTGAEDDPNTVLLRLKNQSSTDFSAALVRFPETEGSYGALAAGEASAYRPFDTAYRYGYVEVEAEGRTYRIQPFDYVGEEPLEKGRYTYRLDLSGGDLEMTFE